MNDLVDVVEGDDVTFENMSTLFRFRKLVARPTNDDVLLVQDVVMEDLLEEKTRGTPSTSASMLQPKPT